MMLHIKPVFSSLHLNLRMQYFVVVVEIFRESACGQVTDLFVEHIRDRQTILFENIEEKDQLVLPLLAIIDIFLKLNQELSHV